MQQLISQLPRRRLCRGVCRGITSRAHLNIRHARGARSERHLMSCGFQNSQRSEGLQLCLFEALQQRLCHSYLLRAMPPGGD